MLAIWKAWDWRERHAVGRQPQREVIARRRTVARGKVGPHVLRIGDDRIIAEAAAPEAASEVTRASLKAAGSLPIVPEN